MSTTLAAPRPRAARHAIRPAAAPDRPATSFRPDIAGLRAVAVILVVAAHAGVGAVAGGYVGVDVFFVISGFVITRLLVGELAGTAGISLIGFYGRRAARLLPASTLVLFATVAASWLWLPPTRFRGVSLDALFTTFYGINWRLAAQGTDYLNAGRAPSPLQHMWSLAVEEQFYLLWPLLLLAVAGIRRHRGTGCRRAVVLVLLTVAAASWVACVRQTQSAAPWAYFGAHTRAWELAVGALIALGSATLARTRAAGAAVLTWGGLAAIGAAAVLFDDGTPFPGYPATLPVLGAAAVIAGGCAAPRAGAGALLGAPGLQWIGRLSYGWYLWHWPVLAIAPVALGVRPTVAVNLLLAVAALGLAVGSYHAMENPVRSRARAGRGLAVGLSLSASAAAFTLLAGMFSPVTSTGVPALDTAAALDTAPDPQARLVELIAEGTTRRPLPDNLTPAVTGAERDLPATYRDGCHLGYDGLRQEHACVYGNPAGQQTMYLVGDSHAAHWFPAMDLIARQRGWRLVAMTKSACQAPSVLVWQGVLKHPYRECVAFRDALLARIRAEHPAMVVMSSNGGDSGGPVAAHGNRLPTGGEQDDGLWVDGWRDTFRRIAQPGTTLVMIEDTPWPAGSVVDCVSTHPYDVPACNRPVAEAIVEPHRRALVRAMARAEGVTVVDPTPWFCAATCPVVVGNILVYRDDSHQSTAYARLLAPILANRLSTGSTAPAEAPRTDGPAPGAVASRPPAPRVHAVPPHRRAGHTGSAAID